MNSTAMNYLCAFLLGIFCVAQASAQFPQHYSSSQLFHELQKADKLGSILYIAAHPDDENTRLISYFENELLARTAYLSLTRGDGGQNLIGTEIGAAIGVLRTQELQAARRIDGGEQYFTRAVDFGYSKSSLETLEKWNREDILADVVWVIRQFKPDAIVTRFPPSNAAGHGHHEASALLAEEAFVAAADHTRFPEQLAHVEPWQTKRLYFNASSWWLKDLPERARNNDNYLRVNVGKYNPLLGETYARIASRSRSQHRSQGFGTDVYYGLNIEYMEYVLGEKADVKEGILDGVDQGWGRVDADQVGVVLSSAIRYFDHSAPHHTIAYLLDAIELLSQKPRSPMVDYKIQELEALIVKLAGIHIEAVADDYYYTPGESAQVRVNFVHQYHQRISMTSIEAGDLRLNDVGRLSKAEFYTEEIRINVPEDAPYSNHYWLREPWENKFVVNDPTLLGKAENQPALSVKVGLTIDDYDLRLTLPVVHKTIDPVKAVIYRPVQIVPPLTFSFNEDVIVSTGLKKNKLAMYVTNHNGSIAGDLSLGLPDGWTSSPGVHAFESSKKGTVQRFDFILNGDAKAGSGKIHVQFSPKDGSKTMEEFWKLSEIAYDHIPTQIYMLPAEINLEVFDLAKGKVKRVGYIEGPGDDVAKCLQAAGLAVDILSADAIQSSDLAQYDAIITGIRAYNTREDLTYLNAKLNAYVSRGGTLLVQYNTSRGVKSEEIGPYEFTIGRERVTDEEAKPNFLLPDHPVMNQPNKVTLEDFDRWVQERGLYFASEWDPAFSAVIGWSDPGEPERKGGLIVAPYGKGYFAYTGISFFRQLPAGVPGAYRLLFNILNLKNPEGTEQ